MLNLVQILLLLYHTIQMKNGTWLNSSNQKKKKIRSFNVCQSFSAIMILNKSSMLSLHTWNILLSCWKSKYDNFYLFSFFFYFKFSYSVLHSNQIIWNWMTAKWWTWNRINIDKAYICHIISDICHR